MTGSGAINGTGNASNNTLTGNSGKNVLNGKSGADILNGGAGNDMVVNVEQVNMAGGGGDTLILAKRDILDMSVTDTLKIWGDRTDTVDLRGTFSDLGVSRGLHRYKSGGAVVLVENELTVV